MNKRYAIICFWLLLLAALLPAAKSGAQNKKTSAGDQFFIVASIDLSKSQILLKQPTEVTRLLNITAATEVIDTNGTRVHPSDLRAGDTVWVLSSGQGRDASAMRIRKGPMTAADLHRLYLDYPEIK